MIDTALTVQNGNALIRVPLESIRYIESRRHYLVIRALSGSFRIRAKISDYAERLSHAGFVQIHRCYVVNAQHVKSTNAREMMLFDGERLPVGRQYRDMAQKL